MELVRRDTQMQTFQRWIVFGLLALSSPSYADGISGTYVGRGSNSLFLVQLVETNGGQLTGRYEQTVLQPNGKLEQMNASITGASDGRTVVVTIKPTELLSGSFTASGTIEGSTIHLSGGGYGSTLNLNLIKSEESAFRALVADLTNQSHQIIATRALQEESALPCVVPSCLIAGSVYPSANTPSGSQRIRSGLQRYRIK